MTSVVALTGVSFPTIVLETVIVRVFLFAFGISE